MYVFKLGLSWRKYISTKISSGRDRGATKRFGGGGGGAKAPLVTQYWGSTRHFFSLNLYNFQNIGGHVPPCPPTPWSLSGSGLPAASLTYFNDGGGGSK